MGTEQLPALPGAHQVTWLSLVSPLTSQKEGHDWLGGSFPIDKLLAQYLERVLAVLMLLSNFFRLRFIDFK